VRTHRPVAVKALKLPPSVSRELRVSFVDGFEREAQILARLRHEAIVEVLDLSEAPDADGVMWMVLEWVEGARFDHGGRRASRVWSEATARDEAAARGTRQLLARRSLRRRR